MGRVSGHAVDRVDEEPAAVEPLQAEADAVVARGGDQCAERGRLRQRMPLDRAHERHRPGGDDGLGRALHAQVDVDGSGGGRWGDDECEQRRQDGREMVPADGRQRFLLPREVVTCPREAGLLARARFPVSRASRLAFPALAGQWPSNDAPVGRPHSGGTAPDSHRLPSPPAGRRAYHASPAARRFRGVRRPGNNRGRRARRPPTPGRVARRPSHRPAGGPPGRHRTGSSRAGRGSAGSAARSC